MGLGVYPVSITTDRLVLRDHRFSDARHYPAWICDPDVMRFVNFPMPRTHRAARRQLREIVRLARGRERTHWYLGIYLRETGDYVGDVGLDLKRRANAGGVGVLGYFIAKRYWGRGYATEAARALIDFAFDELDLHRVVATCDAENEGSRRVLEKCGMTLEGVSRLHRYREGRWRDGLTFAVLRAEAHGRSSAGPQ